MTSSQLISYSMVKNRKLSSGRDQGKQENGGQDFYSGEGVYVHSLMS